jgi:predicted enzyme related to lactoylglutathione lyase
MPEITSYVQGTPSWVDLSTTDEKGALAFYSALFKWEDDPQEMGPDSFYHQPLLSRKDGGTTPKSRCRHR